MIRMLSLFSGIGAFEQALKNIGYDVDIVNFSEIDKYAVKSYCAIHDVDESRNLGDITKIEADELPSEIDLTSYGFPCQDISISGSMKGFVDEEGNVTRSGLFFEALRVIETVKPKIAIAENVKNLTGKRFTNEFAIVLKSLEEAGYTNYWAVLDATDFGVPQHRERVIIVSIRNDIDDGYEFPLGWPLNKCLADYLEDDSNGEVPEKYYIENENTRAFLKKLEEVADGE